MSKILLAGFLGSIVMFIWTGIAHEKLPLGKAGIRRLPDEAAFINAVSTTLGDHRGLYLFPSPDVGPNATHQEKENAIEQMKEKVTKGPSGMLMYHPNRGFAFKKGLIVEYLTEFSKRSS